MSFFDQVEPGATVVTKPVVLVEVVSRESVERDLFEKRGEYLAIESLEAYVAFFEEEPRCIAYAAAPRRSSIVTP